MPARTSATAATHTSGESDGSATVPAVASAGARTPVRRAGSADRKRPHPCRSGVSRELSTPETRRATGERGSRLTSLLQRSSRLTSLLQGSSRLTSLLQGSSRLTSLLHCRHQPDAADPSDRQSREPQAGAL